MNIGKMTERIMFQKGDTVIDENANHRVAWTDYYECFAYAYTYQASEKNETGRTIPNHTIEFTTRWCPELNDLDTTKYRIVFHEKNYDISSADMMNYDNKSIKFVCTNEERETGVKKSAGGSSV